MRVRTTQVETIGDAYMVVGGCPVRIPDHASQVATMALDLLHQSGKFKLKHLPDTPLRLRIGLHTGERIPPRNNKFPRDFLVESIDHSGVRIVTRALRIRTRRLITEKFFALI